MYANINKMRKRPIRAVLIVNGFPLPDRPFQGLANLRTARAVGELTDLKVVLLRSWKLGRSLTTLSEYEYGGVPITTLAIPQLPVASAASFLINVALYRSLGWLLLRSLLRGRDLIHSVDALPGIVASEWARRAQIRHVYQAIGGDVNTRFPKVRTARTIAGWEKYVHGVACVSRMLEVGFRSLYPDVLNVRTVYRGVDLDRFHPIGPTAGPLSDRPPPRYLFLGGFPPYPTEPYRSNTKGGETLLAAWKMAEEELITENASLLVAGPDSNSDCMASWRSSLRQPNRVSIADALSPEIVSAYMRASDVILLPSLQEGLPNVAMEASACAKPVFGSNIGGIPEVVVHEETGVLLPAGDVTAWKGALIRYARQPYLLRTMGERARLRMEMLFDYNQYAPQIIDLYHLAINHPLSIA